MKPIAFGRGKRAATKPENCEVGKYRDAQPRARPPFSTKVWRRGANQFLRLGKKPVSTAVKAAD